jgi:ABC-type multidrug transport system ATPase subunit
MSVDLNQVGHRFGKNPWLFRDLTLKLVAGSPYALTGRSGAGKSTLLAILAGQLSPVEGSIAGTTSAICVFQHPIAPPSRTVLDIASLPLLARGDSLSVAMEQAMNMLERFHLASAATRPSSTLSGGEAQRLMLARALLAAPPLLLVDEPTAQLDKATAAGVHAVIAQLCDANTIVVVATHDPGVIDACKQLVEL